MRSKTIGRGKLKHLMLANNLSRYDKDVHMWRGSEAGTIMDFKLFAISPTVLPRRDINSLKLASCRLLMATFPLNRSSNYKQTNFLINSHSIYKNSWAISHLTKIFSLKTNHVHGVTIGLTLTFFVYSLLGADFLAPCQCFELLRMFRPLYGPKVTPRMGPAFYD